MARQNINVRQVPSEYQVRVTRSGRRVYTAAERENYKHGLNIVDQIISITLLTLVWGGVMVAVINQILAAK